MRGSCCLQEECGYTHEEETHWNTCIIHEYDPGRYLQKKVQSRTTAPRHQEGLRRCGASVTQWGLGDGYLGSTLVPLLSRATDQWPQSAQVRCTPQCCSWFTGHIWGMAIFPPTVGTLCPCAISPSRHCPCTHLPIPSSKSQIEADCKSDWLPGQMGGLHRIAFVFAQLSRIWVMMKVDPPRCARINNCKQSLRGWRP